MSNSTTPGTIQIGPFEVSATIVAFFSFLSSLSLFCIYVIRKCAKISYSKEKGLKIEPGLAGSSPTEQLPTLEILTEMKK